MDLVAVLEGLIAHPARLRPLQFDLMVGAKPFQHGIKTLTRPGQQITKLVDSSPIATFGKASIGGLKLLAWSLRVQEPCQLLLVIEPAAQGLSQGRVT